ncbi:MAG: hypothetical protein HC846_03935 [Blastocatellia bacterium]|nr:hypothetical protein [Blastocatellia bacterium]
MSKIVLSTFGSLGDVHPKIALGLELRKRSHEVVFNVMEGFREKFDSLGFEISPLRPNLNPEDKGLARKIMDTKNGSEFLFKEVFIPNLRPMYEDMMRAVEGADLIITGEIVLPIRSVVEKTGIKWISPRLPRFLFFLRTIRAFTQTPFF